MAAEESGDVKCKGCGKLLGKIRGGLFVVRQHDWEFTVDAEGQVLIRCPKCGLLRIVKVACQESA